MPCGLFYFNSLNRSIFYIRDVWLVFILSYFVAVSVLYANSVNPDQTLHSAPSDLGIHCFPTSLLGDARHKWVILYTFLENSADNKPISISQILSLLACSRKEKTPL